MKVTFKNGIRLIIKRVIEGSSMNALRNIFVILLSLNLCNVGACFSITVDQQIEIAKAAVEMTEKDLGESNTDPNPFKQYEIAKKKHERATAAETESYKLKTMIKDLKRVAKDVIDSYLIIADALIARVEKNKLAAQDQAKAAQDQVDIEFMDQELKKCSMPMTLNKLLQSESFKSAEYHLYRNLNGSLQQTYIKQIETLKEQAKAYKPPQLINFDLATIDLPTLTRTFFAYPECQGDFRDSGFFKNDGRCVRYNDSNHYLPSPNECGVSRTAFEEALTQFKTAFDKEMYKKSGEWFDGNEVDFKANKCSLQERINYAMNSLQGQGSAPTVRYLQREKVGGETKMHIMGDYHGSVHSLLRNLWRLVALGKLDPDLTIKDPNVTLVCQGDFIDRGRRGVEVLVTLMALKLKNWNNLILIVGNHETNILALRDGFFEEIYRKYGEASETPYKENKEKIDSEKIMANHDIKNLCERVYSHFFDLLPVAFISQCNDTAILCCHGGIEPRVQLKDFLTSTATFLNVGEEKKCSGFFWNDFCNEELLEQRTNKRSANFYTLGKKGTNDYLAANRPLLAVSRAHQDLFGVLMFGNKKFNPSESSDDGPNGGPYRWNKIAKNDTPGKTDCTFLLHEFDYPVITFSSAVEPRNFPRDNFGVITLFKDFKEWTLEVYEYFLGKTTHDTTTKKTTATEFERHGKYVQINVGGYSGCCTERTTPDESNPATDHLGVLWKDNFDPDELEKGMRAIVDIAKSNKESTVVLKPELMVDPSLNPTEAET